MEIQVTISLCPGRNTDPVALSDKNIGMAAFTVSFDSWGRPYTNASASGASSGISHYHYISRRILCGNSHNSRNRIYTLNYPGSKRQSSSGFTLIEIILTLVVASILGTILVQVMGINYSDSAQNLLSGREGFEVRQQLESITKDYRLWLDNYPNQSIMDFKSGYVDTYSGSLNVNGVLNEIDSGNDGNIGILQVTVSTSDNSRSLTAFFTK